MLEAKILADYKEAMKSRDTLRSSVLSFLRAELMNVAVAKKKNSLEDGEVIAVIKKQIKQRLDSIDQFSKGARQDLADKEKKEMDILKVYVPPELSKEEVQEIVRQAVSQVGAQGPADMGKVMKEVLARVQGQADGRMVSELVRQVLAHG